MKQQIVLFTFIQDYLMKRKLNGVYFEIEHFVTLKMSLLTI